MGLIQQKKVMSLLQYGLLLEIASRQYHRTKKREKGEKPSFEHVPLTNGQISKALNCSLTEVDAIKRDGCQRGLFDVKLRGQTWCFLLVPERWAEVPRYLADKPFLVREQKAKPESSYLDSASGRGKGEQKATSESSYLDSRRRLESTKRISIKPGKSLKLSDECDLRNRHTQEIDVELRSYDDGTARADYYGPAIAANTSGAGAGRPAAGAAAVAAQRATAVAEAAASRAVTDVPDRAIEHELKEFLLPYFVGRGFALDPQLNRAIAAAIARAKGTIERFRQFIPQKLDSDYPWKPGLFLARGGFMDEFSEFLRQARSANGAIRGKTELDRAIEGKRA